MLEDEADRALRCLEESLGDATAVLVMPETYRRRLRTTHIVERFIGEIRRRKMVIRIFPDEWSAWRLRGALAAEQHDERSTGRCYLDMDEYHQWAASRKVLLHEDSDSISRHRFVAMRLQVVVLLSAKSIAC